VIDASARLDVNATTESGLATFFASFTDLAQATTIARAIRSRIDPVSAAVTTQPSRFTRPFRSLDELRTLDGVPSDVLERAAPYLTVDGDGRINRQRASDTVLVAATGEHVDEPSRLVVVGRGWLDGHPLTHEIQSVYAISGVELVLVHWRERDR
jgi:type II secretory pathway component PulK